MRNYSFGKILLPAAFFALSLNVQSQDKKAVEKIRSQYDLNKLQSIEKEFSNKATLERQNANMVAQQQGWDTEITTKDGRFLEIQKVVDGKPIYYTTFNVDAAKSTRTDHLHNGGSLGLNLMGQSMTAYVWDGGIARATHQEYDGAGGNNRYSVGDGHRTLNFHAAHVTGTIMASGKVAAAKGMAPHAKAIGNQWNNDQAEAVAAAQNGMLVSNHSYGFAARSRTGQVQLPQYFFGGYIDESRGWDEIMFNAPNYLMVVAAGNDGSDNTANNNPTGGFGFNKLTGHATSKNNLVVANAQDANIDANGNLISVAINSSSSEGPTDDFRIKPDITGNGTGVYSSYESSDTAYNSITGTSMASPNVAGTLLILQQHYNNEKSNFMKAATLKGLALHTADDAGASGPDAVFGWGLLNAKRAAQAITNEGSKSKIEELTLAAGQTYTITVDSDGINPLLASISWTDRPGTATTTVNSTNPVLVNDLDLRVTKSGSSFLPYELTGATTNAKRDNNVDPFERVDVANASGTYTITVSHKGNLTGGSQNYALIITGISETPAVCSATVPVGTSLSRISASQATVSWNEIPGATYDVRYRPVGSNNWVTNNVNGTSTTLANLAAATQYQVQVRSKCSSSSSNYSTSVRFTTSAASSGLDTVAPSRPANVQASDITQTTVTINWQASTDNVAVTGYDVYQGETNIGTVTRTSASITGLTANTSYSFSIRAKDAAGNESLAGSVSFISANVALDYCASSSNRSAFEWIDNVELGGMTNPSGDNGGYEDFTSKVATIAQGSTNPMIVSAGFSNTAYTEFWAVWIDFNQNGTFDANELVVNGSSSSAANLTANVTVPTNARLGQTRMRVSMKYNAAQTACETFADGEVEDYTVNITNNSTSNFNTTFAASNAELLGNEDIAKVTLYPNPATNSVQIRLGSKNNAIATYRLISILGQTVQSGSIDKSNIDISKLNSGLYLLEINDGQKAFTTKLVKK